MIKRFRIIKNDFNSVLFEIILPILFIIIGLSLMIESTAVIEPQSLNYSIYEDNVKVPIAADSNSSFLGNLAIAMARKYGDHLNIS